LGSSFAVSTIAFSSGTAAFLRTLTSAGLPFLSTLVPGVRTRASDARNLFVGLLVGCSFWLSLSLPFMCFVPVLGALSEVCCCLWDAHVFVIYPQFVLFV